MLSFYFLTSRSSSPHCFFFPILHHTVYGWEGSVCFTGGRTCSFVVKSCRRQTRQVLYCANLKCASCLTIKCQKKKLNMAVVGPTRTSGSFSDVGGYADFVVKRRRKKKADAAFVDVLFTFVS